MKINEAVEEIELELAIKYLNTIKHDQFAEFGYINQAVPLIISMLQCGEKHKKTVEEIRKILKPLNGMTITYTADDFLKTINNIEQKYLLKEEKR